MKSYILIIILVFSYSVFGQISKAVPKAPPKPVLKAPSKPVSKSPTKSEPSSTVIAEAKPTQKVVVEKTNGDRLTGLFVSGDTDLITTEVSGAQLPLKISEITTLRFGEDTPPLSSASASPIIESPPPTQTTSLSFEVAVVYTTGGAQPVARTEFFLLDKSLDDILSEAGLSRMNGLNYAASFGFGIKGNGLSSEYTSFAQRSAAALKPHILSTTTTDFNGRGRFENISPGTYWILSYAQTRRGFVVWNLEVNIKNGENQIILDQKNAATAF